MRRFALLLALSVPLLYVSEARAQRWAGSELSVKYSARIASFGIEPDLNPTVFQALSFDPVWRLGPRLVLSGHVGIETELTDSDVTSAKRQPLLEDTTVTAAWALPPRLPRGLLGTASLRLSLPTSKEAIARRRIAGFSPAVTLQRPLRLRGGDLVVTPFVTLRATWNWQLTTSVIYDGPSIAGCDPARGDACEELDHSGTRSARAGFVEVVGATAALPGSDLSFTLQVWWVQAWLYGLAPAEDPLGEPIPAATDTDFRHSNVYLLAADWRVTRRLKLSAGFETLSPQRAPDGSLELPLFNRHTQLFVTAAWTL